MMCGGGFVHVQAEQGRNELRVVGVEQLELRTEASIFDFQWFRAVVNPTVLCFREDRVTCSEPLCHISSLAFNRPFGVFGDGGSASGHENSRPQCKSKQQLSMAIPYQGPQTVSLTNPSSGSIPAQRRITCIEYSTLPERN
jgi:hypothetical protein